MLGRKVHKKRNRNIGKMMAGILLGGIVGATVGWLTAPTSGVELRRRLTGDAESAREKAKTAQENVESRARELLAEVKEDAGDVRVRYGQRKIV